MKQSTRSAGFAAMLVAAGAAAAPVAEASVTMTAEETGGDVTFSTGGGTLDLTGLTASPGGGVAGEIFPLIGFVVLGNSPAANANVDLYNGINGPGSFGNGGQLVGQSGSGDRFGIYALFDQLAVPAGFVSGGSIAASSLTFTAQTFAGLGITPGSYTWSWGADETFDSVTLNVVPLPAASFLLLSGLAGLFGFRRMQRRVTAASPTA